MRQKLGIFVISLAAAGIACSSNSPPKYDPTNVSGSTGTSGGASGASGSSGSGSSGSSGSSGTSGSRDAGPLCGDLTGATLTVFSISPPALGITGSTSPTHASVVLAARNAQGANIVGCGVSFTEASGESLLAINPGNVNTDAAGTATTQVNAGAIAGTAHLTATLGGQINTAFTIEVAAPIPDAGPVDGGICGDLTGATLQVFSVTPANIGVPGSNKAPQATVVVAARNGQGANVIGCPVSFTEASGESILTINPGSASTDAAGAATTHVNAGSLAGTAHLTATLGGAVSTAFTIDVADVIPDAGPPDAGPADAGICGDLTGATLGVFSISPATIGVTSSTSPTQATVIMAARNGQGANIVGCPVAFTEASGESLVTISPGSVSSDSAGTATTHVNSGTTVGTAHLTATLASTVSTDFTINVTGGVSATDGGAQPPNSIAWVSTSPTLMGIAGSGRQEQATITFKVLDQRGSPVAGVDVALGQIGVARVSIGTATATTNASGLASTVLQSLSQPGIAEISATVLDSAGNPTTLAALHDVPVRGAQPSATNFYFKCEKQNLPVYTTTLQSETMLCHVALADRFHNPVGIPTTVSFYTEAGTIESSVSTAAFSASNPAVEGTATVTFTSNMANGYNPADVLPLANEPSERVPDGAGGWTKVNPNARDQLVTIIAIANGEEAFHDTNNNGLYDPGEQFDDLGDPFIDANDDNIFDDVAPGGASEQRFCASQNDANCPSPTYSYGNQLWDQNGTIWTSTHVVFSGAATLSNIDNQFGDQSIMTCIAHGGSAYASLYARDANFNRPASGTTYSASLVGSPSGLAASGTLSAELDNLGSINLQYVHVAESDGGLCTASNGAACVVQTVITSFDLGFVGPINVKDTATTAFPDGGAPACGTPFSMQGTVVNAHAVTVPNTWVEGSYQP